MIILSIFIYLFIYYTWTFVNLFLSDRFKITGFLNWEYLGAPNENIVQNHLNIALLNVLYYLNGRFRHIFISQKKGSRKF